MAPARVFSAPHRSVQEPAQRHSEEPSADLASGIQLQPVPSSSAMPRSFRGNAPRASRRRRRSRILRHSKPPGCAGGPASQAGGKLPPPRMFCDCSLPHAVAGLYFPGPWRLLPPRPSTLLPPLPQLAHRPVAWLPLRPGAAPFLRQLPSPGPPSQYAPEALPRRPPFAAPRPRFAVEWPLPAPLAVLCVPVQAAAGCPPGTLSGSRPRFQPMTPGASFPVPERTIRPPPPATTPRRAQYSGRHCGNVCHEPARDGPTTASECPPQTKPWMGLNLAWQGSPPMVPHWRGSAARPRLTVGGRPPVLPAQSLRRPEAWHESGVRKSRALHRYHPAYGRRRWVAASP